MAVAAGITLFVVGTAYAEESRQEAKKSAERSASEQRKAGAEQAAGNAAQAAAERRRQVREERVRRARIMQTSQASGTVGSSGEVGAIGSMATQFSSNAGTNAGSIQRAFNITDFNQNAANFSLDAQQSMSDAQAFTSLGNTGLSIFSMGNKPTAKPATPTS